jgi:hypothetical protein
MIVKMKELEDGNIFELNGEFWIVIEDFGLKFVKQLTGSIPVDAPVQAIEDFSFSRFCKDREVKRYCHQDFTMKITDGKIVAVEPAEWME